MRRTSGLLCAALALGCTSCGGESDEQSAPLTGTCEASKLPGLWTSDTYSIRIESDWSFVAAGAPNVQTIHVSGMVQVDGCTIQFQDTGGMYACPEAQIGRYTFSVSDSGLKLTLASDDCDGRRAPLNGATLSRR